jgi:20S proteasome subunit alpha 3
MFYRAPRTRILIAPVVEFATVGQTEDGKIYHRLWSADEITALLKEHDLAKPEDAEEK